MELALSSKSKWIENFARFGYAAKGVVYCLVGLLAVTAAFGSGSSKEAGKSGALKVILEQPFGKILLAIVAFGLLGYVMWRAIEAIKDPDNNGSDGKGIVKRIGYGISALVYLGLSIYAWSLVFQGDTGKGNNTQKTILDKILDQPYGQVLVGLIAVIIIGKGIQQVIKAVSGKYRKDLRIDKINPKFKDILIKTGGAGYFARGVVWGIIGFLFIRAAIFSNPNEAGGTDHALGFLESGFGPWIMGTIALGLICYGIFKILQARYKSIHV